MPSYPIQEPQLSLQGSVWWKRVRRIRFEWEKSEVNIIESEDNGVGSRYCQHLAHVPQHSSSHKHWLVLPENTRTLPEECSHSRDILNLQVWRMEGLCIKCPWEQPSTKMNGNWRIHVPVSLHLLWDYSAVGSASSPRVVPDVDSQLPVTVTSPLNTLLRSSSLPSPLLVIPGVTPQTNFFCSILFVRSASGEIQPKTECVWYVRAFT